MSEKIYRVQMNNKGMPNFSTAVEIPTVNMPIKEKCCFCPHCSNCDVNDDLTIADRPQGDVDAVDIFEREMHNLEQGYITLGEFDERIEPLRHLCYGRPQEWIPCSERLPDEKEGVYLICTDYGYLCSCRWTNGVYGLGATKWSAWGWHLLDVPQYSKVVAWMDLKPYKGENDEA